MSFPKMWNLFGSDHLPYRLLLLARMIDRQTTRQLQNEFGLSLAEWRVLAFIGTSGPDTASAIGQAGEIDRAEISRAVARLEDKGLTSRTPDKENRRRLIIALTPAGVAKFKTVRDDRRHFFQALMDGMPQGQRTVVENAIEQLALKIRKLEANGESETASTTSASPGDK